MRHLALGACVCLCTCVMTHSGEPFELSASIKSSSAIVEGNDIILSVKVSSTSENEKVPSIIPFINLGIILKDAANGNMEGTFSFSLVLEHLTLKIMSFP